MSHFPTSRIAVLGGFSIAVYALVRAAPRLDVATMFILVMLLGLVGAMIFARIVLPWIGDRVATFFYSSGEKISASENNKAAALVAKGDFEGAIAEYESMLEKTPTDLLAISEVVKLRTDRLDDAAGALQWLRDRIFARQWNDDERAFLRFRLVDVLSGMNGREAEARRELQSITADFPGTRHAANARHRLHAMRGGAH